MTLHHLIFINDRTYNEFDSVLQENFACSPSDWKGFIRKQLPEIKIDKLIENINNIKKQKHSLDVSIYPNFTDKEIREYYSGWDFKPSSYPLRCLSPWMVAYIFPDGSVRPFHSVNFIAGNIKEMSFKKIWNSNRYCDYRNLVKQKGCFSVCTRCTEFYRY